MRVELFIATVALLFGCGTILVAAEDIEPRIPPGYTPETVEMELDIWMELKEYESKIQQSALLVRDEPINQYVRSVACRVAGPYCADFRVYIIRNPGFNASMTANGAMVIWTGLVVRLSSEDELAAVLGHELAHYTQLHTLDRFRRIKRSMAAGTVFDLGLILLAGVSTPAGQLAAVASAMSFSRDQEREADLLGARFMAEAGYDPHAAARVWRMIVEEEAGAAVKSREPGLFTKTHPDVEARIVSLNKFVGERYPELDSAPTKHDRHVTILNRYYMLLMEEQLDTNRFGRTEAMLRTHERIGVTQTLIDFFRGEMYRQRNGEGDLESAKAAYLRAVEGDSPVADAYLNLGYIYLKERDLDRARYNFTQYLELEPEADDRAMIEFYLQEPGS